jgi:hypothetical protein
LAGWHALPQAAARGGDHVTADASAVTRHGPIAAVGPRLQTKRSRATGVRRWSMPQATGTERPRGRPAREATRVPRAGAQLCAAISAPALRECRDGSCVGRGAVDAGRDRPGDRHDGRDGALGDAASTGGVEPRDPPWLWDRWRRRLAARALLPLRRPWLQAGLWDTEGQGVQPATGPPQGGTGSPVLAQGSLHSALALGLEQVVQPRGRGEARWGRSAEAGGGPSAGRRTQNGVGACGPPGWRNATAKGPQSTPSWAGAAVCTRARRGASPGWAARFAGHQRGTACPAACGAPHARRATPLANGARNGSNTTGRCRGGQAFSVGRRDAGATPGTMAGAGTPARFTALAMGRGTGRSPGSIGGAASGAATRGSSCPAASTASRARVLV